MALLYCRRGDFVSSKSPTDAIMLDCLLNSNTYTNSYIKVSDLWVSILEQLRDYEELERFLVKAKDLDIQPVILRALHGFSKVL
jgi:hypothetical protein